MGEVEGEDGDEDLGGVSIGSGAVVALAKYFDWIWTSLASSSSPCLG